MDNIYDSAGNVVRYGAGIHPNAAGYRIMAEAIPLNLFQDFSSGLKMYLDEYCLTEAVYNDSDKQHPFYLVELTGLTYNRTSRIVRYIKNIGQAQCIFALYQTNHYNLSVEFKIGDDTAVGQDVAYGVLVAGGVVKVYIEYTAHTEDSSATVQMHMASREFNIQ